MSKKNGSVGIVILLRKKILFGHSVYVRLYNDEDDEQNEVTLSSTDSLVESDRQFWLLLHNRQTSFSQILYLDTEGTSLCL